MVCSPGLTPHYCHQFHSYMTLQPGSMERELRGQTRSQSLALHPASCVTLDKSFNFSSVKTEIIKDFHED